MLSRIEVRNFQSLHNVKLDLLPLTVVVGASSSGKSAFTRALRTLTSNKRGTDFITHGEKLTTISAVTDAGSVTLKRGKGTNDNEYIVTPSAAGETQRTYTKLGGETPPEVSEFIGIASKDPINYAGQFDKPYLLDDSAGEVARVLGALTNVSVIFEAAAESNRRKLKASATLKTRAADLAIIKEKAQGYRGLKAQLAAIEQAEKNLTTARELTHSLSRLDSLLGVIEAAEHSIASLKPFLDLSIPDPTRITEAAGRLNDFNAHLSHIREQATLRKAAEATTAEQETQALTLELEYIRMLTEAGTCPTCQQSTTHLD